MALDSKDKQIIYQLDLDSKQSANQIAKLVKLSKDAVNYRINKLFKEKILLRKFCVLNTPSLGLIHYKFLIKLQNASHQKEKEILDFFIHHNHTIWCVKTYGSWDVSVSYLVTDIIELNRFINELISKYGRFIKEKSISQIIDSPTFARNYLLNKKTSKFFEYKQSSKRFQLDKLDRLLLAELSLDSNQTYIELANKLNTTRDIILYKVKQLQKKNIIQGFRIMLNHEEIGIKYYKIMFNVINLTEQEEKRFFQFCKDNPHIIQVIKYIGPWEIEIELESFTEKEIYEILFEIRKDFSNIISSYEILKLEEKKLNYYPFGKEKESPLTK